MQGGFSKAYKTKGVTKFYEETGKTYHNPHAYDIERILRKKLSKPNPYIKIDSKILDMACGSGQITKPLKSYGYKNIKGTDPYTAQAFKANTGLECDEYNFVDILGDCYYGEKFDCIICSYAMHLVKQSMLHDFCNKLTEITNKLIIISPHKFPIIKHTYGWKCVEEYVQDKIHFRVFTVIQEQYEQNNYQAGMQEAQVKNQQGQ